MANILTAAEAAIVLRCETTDPDMLQLLPLVDTYIENATGRNWAGDSPIPPEAKTAARILLVRWHEDPGGMSNAMGPALSAALTQLEAVRLHYVEIEGLSRSGYIFLPMAHEGDRATSVIGLTAGLTGDQSALFEVVISENSYFKQLADTNLDDKYFRVYLTPLSEQ